MARFFSIKKYGHERGLSAAFRQWRADSHCKFLHGYSLEFEFEFGAHELDERNWVVDFGGISVPTSGAIAGAIANAMLINESETFSCFSLNI